MFKKLLILLAALSLQGCFWQSINQYDLADAAKLCGGYRSIAVIDASVSGNETVTCNDNRRLTLHRKILKQASIEEQIEDQIDELLKVLQ